MSQQERGYKLINLTPHNVVFRVTWPAEDGTEVTKDYVVPRSGTELRIEEEKTSLGVVFVELTDEAGNTEMVPIELLHVELKRPSPPLEELPGWDDPNTIYITSAIVVSTISTLYPPEVAGRFVAPANQIRNDKGIPVAATALSTSVNR